jgi:hypothetical protein
VSIGKKFVTHDRIIAETFGGVKILATHVVNIAER